MLIFESILYQAMHANTSVAAGLEGASKAMGAMNKVLNFTFSISIC